MLLKDQILALSLHTFPQLPRVFRLPGLAWIRPGLRIAGNHPRLSTAHDQPRSTFDRRVCAPERG